MTTVKLGDRLIGPDQPPFFVAELGICHGGNLETALMLARAAAEAGADAIKTETFNRELMVFDPSAECSYVINGQKVTYPLAEHMDRYELPLSAHKRIKEESDRLGLPFFSTAHDFESIDFLVEIGSDAVKIASADLIHYPLLRYAARQGLPVILDTGGALQHEVEIAVDLLRDEGQDQIIINHNPAGHPGPAEWQDLRIIPRLQDILGVPVGLADHYEGYNMVYAAAAVGAHLIEKPISEDRFVPEPERNWSISLADLPQVLATMKEFYTALGVSKRTLSPQAKLYRDQNRMACAAAKDLAAGAELTLETVAFGRPRLGIGVEFWDQVEGKKLRRAKKQHQFITWEDLD